MAPSIFIDTDNACGSLFGDIDDAFALAALLASNIDISGICSVFGNTSAQKSLQNTRNLTEFFLKSAPARQVPLLEGSKSRSTRPDHLTNFFNNNPGKFRYAALGPLTNLAYCCDHAGGSFMKNISEVVIVGANTASSGQIPPFWPHEFNLTKDRSATRKVFSSGLKLTVFPLNVVKNLTFDANDIASFPEPIKAYFIKHSRRWILRNLLLKGRTYFPVWDLAAAMYLIKPQLFSTRQTTVHCSRMGHLQFDLGNQPVKLITGFDRDRIKKAYLQVLNSYFLPQSTPSQ